jgi:GT2 family glycosyltransferase
MTPGIDIVVVNYRTAYDLTRFCESVLQYPPRVPYTMRIFNVAPYMRDIEVAHDYAEKIPNCMALGTNSNIGYGRAANNAAGRGRHDTIAVFNADVMMTERAFDACFEALHDLGEEGRNGDLGVLGPRQVDSRGILRHGGVVGEPQRLVQRGFGQPAGDAYRDNEDVTMVLGSAMFVPRWVWRRLFQCKRYRSSTSNALGPLLETPLYFEDTWLCAHARAHGLRIRYQGDTTIVHEWHQSIDKHAPDAQHMFFDQSQQVYRRLCDDHGIEHE